VFDPFADWRFLQNWYEDHDGEGYVEEVWHSGLVSLKGLFMVHAMLCVYGSCAWDQDTQEKAGEESCLQTDTVTLSEI
jgi:hypothetical protein